MLCVGTTANTEHRQLHVSRVTTSHCGPSFSLMPHQPPHPTHTSSHSASQQETAKQSTATGWVPCTSSHCQLRQLPARSLCSNAPLRAHKTLSLARTAPSCSKPTEAFTDSSAALHQGPALSSTWAAACLLPYQNQGPQTCPAHGLALDTCCASHLHDKKEAAPAAKQAAAQHKHAHPATPAVQACPQLLPCTLPQATAATPAASAAPYHTPAGPKPHKNLAPSPGYKPAGCRSLLHASTSSANGSMPTVKAGITSVPTAPQDQPQLNCKNNPASRQELLLLACSHRGLPAAARAAAAPGAAAGRQSRFVLSFCCTPDPSPSSCCCWRRSSASSCARASCCALSRAS